MRRLNEDVTLWATVAVGTLIWFSQKPATEKALAEMVHAHSSIIVSAPIAPRVGVLAENALAEINAARSLQGDMHVVEAEAAQQQAEAAQQQAELCDKQAEKISDTRFSPLDDSL